MKSYIQGIITGGALVFASMVLMGANKDGDIGRYIPIYITKSHKVVMMDSQTGDLYFPSKEGWRLDMIKNK